MQRQVLYLGEINDSQEAAWRKTIEVFDERKKEYEQLSLFPSGRELIMPRYTEPEAQQEMILEKLDLQLPKQPKPRIRAGELPPLKA